MLPVPARPTLHCNAFGGMSVGIGNWLLTLGLGLAAPAAGQAAAPLPATSQTLLADQLRPADANLFFYRDYAQPTLWGVTLLVDGVKVISLGQNKYTGVTVAPGEHTIRVKWAGHTGQASGTFNVEVKPGQPMFLEVVGEYGPLQRTGRGYRYTATSGMLEQDPAAATAAIHTCCKFRAPAKEWQEARAK